VLIYLDIDGVLNTTAQRAARQHLDNELIASLHSVLDAVPGAAIVLSSSWRLQPPLKEALEARLVAEGINAVVGVTGQAPLVERDPGMRGDISTIDAELRRLARQRATEIHASVTTRQPQAWIAIDDLDLRPPLQSTLRMGYPPSLLQQVQQDETRARDCHEGKKSCVKTNIALPPLAARRPFALKDREGKMAQHPLAGQLPRRRSSSRSLENSNGQHAEIWIDPGNFVHTSEAAGLTRERAQFAIQLLQAQMVKRM
jgi:hypothetical protein